MLVRLAGRRHSLRFPAGDTTGLLSGEQDFWLLLGVLLWAGFLLQGLSLPSWLSSFSSQLLFSTDRAGLVREMCCERLVSFRLCFLVVCSQVAPRFPAASFPAEPPPRPVVFPTHRAARPGCPPPVCSDACAFLVPMCCVIPGSVPSMTGLLAASR